jgi:hypothetical protein
VEDGHQERPLAPARVRSRDHSGFPDCRVGDGDVFQLVVLLPVALTFLPLPGGTDLLVKIARWPVLFVVTAFALAVLIGHGLNLKAKRHPLSHRTKAWRR